MDIKLYDEILLKDGRIGIVIEIYKPKEGYEVEFLIDDTGEYPEFETETIEYKDVKGIIISVGEPMRRALW